jgi:flagellar biosynthesis protein FlhF
MRLRTFEAPSMQAALARMREALGAEAVIVATREEAGRVRLTAAADTSETDLETLLAPAPPAPALATAAAALEHHGLAAGAVSSLLGGVVCGPSDPGLLLASALAGRLRFGPTEPSPASSLVLVGPPGAGKTTTVARLAAMGLLAGLSVEVRNADERRAGALDQLRALLAPMRLVPAPIEAEAGTVRSGGLVLVDSPGVNPFDRTEMAELAATVRRLGLEAVLVMPAGLAVGDAVEIAATFQVLGVRRMITTRLDAARRLGGLVAAAELGLELAWATTGPEIGKPLVPWTASGLARLLLARAPRQLVERP